MDAMQQFPFRLESLRREKGLNQSDLAKELGVSRGSISFYEGGERTPDIDFLRKACEFFNVSADYLVGLSDSRQAEFRRFTEQTGFDYSTVEKLSFISGNGRPEECFETHRTSFELLLNSRWFNDLLENLRDYLMSNLPKEEITDFDDMLIYFDKNIRKVSKENLQVLPSALASKIFLYNAQETIVNIFEDIAQDEKKAHRWYMALHPDESKEGKMDG